MSYVDVDAPLPRNGRSPVPACETAAARAQVQAVERMVARGKAAAAQVASPESFAGLGRGVQRDVVRSQRELIAAQQFKTTRPKESRPSDAVSNAPNHVPLNVPMDVYAGCAIRNEGPLLPVEVSPDQQRIVMPPPAPTDTNLLLPENTGLTPEVLPRGGFVQPPAPAVKMFMGYQGTPAMPRGMSGVPWGDSTADPRARVLGGSGISGRNLLWLALGGVGLYAVTRKKGRR